MKTTEQWLSEIKASPEKLNEWLRRQYIGEALAAQRIRTLANSQPKFSSWLNLIADQESSHMFWVGTLLVSRGLPIPKPTYEDTRYWGPILGNLHTFEEVAGAGYHAERMRLLRIEALATDPEIAEDIRDVFKRILPEERFHEKAFFAMSTNEAVKSTLILHQQGLDLLGLREEY